MKLMSGTVPRLSRRALLKSALGASTVAVIASPYVARAKPSSMVIASSGGKLEETFVTAYYKPWTKRTGIDVVTTVNTYAKLKAMVEANAVEWDVAQVDSSLAANYSLQGLLEPLDYSIIDKSSLLPKIAREHYTPSDVAGCVIAWNTKSVKPDQVPQSWAEFWNLQKVPGQRGLWKQPYQIVELALLADGVAKDKLYPLDVDRAFKSLDKIKSQIFWWTSGGQSAQILIDGEVPVAMTWNGRVYEPKLNKAPVDFHFNDSLFVADAWVVPKGAKNKREAMEFIAFALQPENQAEFSKGIPYGPVVPAALKLLDPDRLAVLPSSEANFKKGVFQDFDWWAQNGQKTGERFNSWMLG